jgi:hypothetical protein
MVLLQKGVFVKIAFNKNNSLRSRQFNFNPFLQGDHLLNKHSITFLVSIAEEIYLEQK